MKSRITFIDTIRVYATIGVVWLHVSANALLSSPDQTGYYWWVANLADSFSRWCVPVFVMITGRLCLSAQPHPSWFEFYKKSFKRISPPLIFWTVIFVAFSYITNKQYGWNEIWASIIVGKPYYHLWYIFMLVGLYIATPAITKCNDQFVSKRPAPWIFFIFVLGSIDQLILGQDRTFITSFIPYIGFFLAGHYITPNFLGSGIARKLAIILMLGLAIAVATWVSLPYFGRQSYSIWYAYLNPLVIAMSLTVFALLMSPRFEIYPILLRLAID